MFKKILGLSLICLLIVLMQLPGSYAKENLAFMSGCEYTASSTYFPNSDLPPDAFDGNPSTKWGSRGVGNKPGDKIIDVDEWIQVTFPEPVVISDVYLLQDTVWSNIFAYEILVKQGDQWVQVHQAEYTEQFPDEVIEFTNPVTTTEFRVHVTKAGPETSSCNFFEIEINGVTEREANATPSPTPTEKPVTPTPDKPAVTATPVKTNSAGTTAEDNNNVFIIVWVVCGIAVLVSIIAVLIVRIKKKS